WRAFIRQGVEKPGRSQKLQGLALAALNAGWTCNQYIAVVLSHPDGAGAKLNGRRDAERYLGRGWQHATEYAQSHPSFKDRADVLAYVAKLRRRANRWRFPKKMARTYRHVLEAHFEIVEQTGKLVHAASLRQVAKLAKLNQPAVHKA